MALKGTQITVAFTAWDTANNVAKTGDSGNFTLRVIKDGSSATPTNSASEVDSTNCPGIYKITLTSTEMSADTVTLAGKSSTSGVVILPVHIITESGRIDAAVSTRATPDQVSTAITNYAPSKAGDKMNIVDSPNSTGVSAIVDAFLTRSFASVTYSGATRCVLTALQKLRNKVANSDTTQTVYKEDDTTASYTSALTTAPGAEPITVVDPN